MLRSHRSTSDPRLELTPLMDLMFLLLTFFIFAFALMVRLKVTDVRLPEASAGQEPARTPTVLVALRASGELLVNDAPSGIDSVADDVRAAMERSRGAALLVAIDEAAPSGDLFRLMDALRAGGFQDLRFLRMPKEGAER